MKKLMIAASAALCAAVGFSDDAQVQSANIVGYVNSGLSDGGQLVSAAFMRPGATDGFRVSDIKMTGYQEDAGFYQAGDFTADFCLLSAGGASQSGDGNHFIYTDPIDWDDESYPFLGGFWATESGATIEPGDENDLVLEPAQAVWLQVPANDGEHTFKFVTAGEVIINKDITLNLGDGGNAVGNPFATKTKVTDMSITGYQEDAGFYQAGDFTADFCLLSAGGASQSGDGNHFVFTDPIDWDDETYPFLGGFWATESGTTIEPGDENDLELEPNQGIWLQVPANDGEHTFQLIFKKLTI